MAAPALWFPPEVTDSVVIVELGAAHAGSSPTPWLKETTAMKHHKRRKRASNSPPPVNDLSLRNQTDFYALVN